MRSPKSIKSAPGTQVSGTFFFPAPIGGLNTREPRALVPLNESPSMTNCYPTNSGIKRRTGWDRWIFGIFNPVESLMVYSTPSGTEQLFAASGVSFFNITTSGTPFSSVTGLTNATWEYVNFTNSSGTSYLCCFNGVDPPQYYDGSFWYVITGVSSIAITGLTTTTIATSFVHQRRMWFVQTNSLKAWYLPPDSVGGAAKAFDIGGIASLGGYIVAGSTWTVDGGAGLDDYWVVVTSQGQVVAYQGTDPSSASTWQLVGVWNIAAPVGRRCMFRHKGDLLIITQAGVASIARVMQGDTSASSMITDKIRETYRLLYAASGPTTRLWMMAYDPTTDLLYLCPQGDNMYPMNATTGAWGGNYGLNATCLAVFGGYLYYGLDSETSTETGTQVRKLAGAGGATSEESVTMYLDTAYSDYGMPGIIKQTTAGRIAGIASATDLRAGFEAVVDFRGGSIPTASTISSFTGLSDWFPLKNAGVTTALMTTIYTSPANGALGEFYGFYVVFQPGGLVGASTST